MIYKYRALITAPPILPKIMTYKNIFDENSTEIIIPPFDVIESLNESQLISLLSEIDGILCGDDQITKNVLESAKRLKVISKWGTGIDSIDKDAAERLGIKVLRVKNLWVENRIFACRFKMFVARSDRIRNSWNQELSGRKSIDLDRLVFFEKI